MLNTINQFQLYGFRCLGMMSTTASLGLILLWDVDAGLTQIDKYLYSTEDYIKVWSSVIPMSSNISNMIDCGGKNMSYFIYIYQFSSTEKRVENMARHRLFLMKFKVFGNLVKQCLEWCTCLFN